MMNFSRLLNFILGGALIAVTVLLVVSQKPNPEETDATPVLELKQAEAAVLKNIATRASVRAFKRDAVPDKLVEKLLKAGMAAPTALNAQPWHFIVIRDHGQLSSLSVASEYTGLLANAPLAIAVCGDMTKKAPSAEGIYWTHDACAASENILLAAHAMGLGATWTGSYPIEARYKLAQKVLSLPDHLIPVSIIAIGYPAIPVDAKDKWNPQNVSYQ
jgi:nitroreductase